jgi:hypothetical protein
VVALIAALGGTALAASGALTGKQKKEVEKIAKKYAGKPGAPGAAGANGTNGANGKDGSNGAAGAPGKDGESVTLAASASCGVPGGTKVSVGAVSKDVCNGKAGDAGESPIGTPFSGEDEPTGNPCGGDGGVNYIVEGVESPVCNGSPWSVGGTLPPGATETGSWAFNGGVQTITVEVGGTEEEITIGDTEGIRVPISFAVPLPLVITNPHAHYGVAGSGGAFSPSGACPTEGGEGPGAVEPTALPGELCIYQHVEEGLVGATFNRVFKYNTLTKGTGIAGGVLLFDPTAATAFGAGSFAVTSCVPNEGHNGCAGP